MLANFNDNVGLAFGPDMIVTVSSWEAQHLVLLPSTACDRQIATLFILTKDVHFDSYPVAEIVIYMQGLH